MISKLPGVGSSIFSVMSRLAREHNAINLSQGFPDFPGDAELIREVHIAMAHGHNQYAPMAGVPELREAIANKMHMVHGLNIDPNKQITITAGATEALFCAIASLINPGDKVMIIEPAYDSYKPVLQLFGAEVHHFALSKDSFSVDWDRLEAKLDSSFKLIITNSPQNPISTVFKYEDWGELERLVRKFDLYLLSDEVYEHIIFDGLVPDTAQSYAGLKDRCISVFSFGKCFHYTGWKTGYAVGPDDWMEEFRKIHQYNVFSVHTPTQYALAEYLNQPKHYDSIHQFYERKRDLFQELIADSGFSLMPCQGSYFVCADYSKLSDLSDMEFASEMTKQYGVATIPLSAFYTEQQNQKLIRFCFAKEDKTLVKAGKILSGINNVE